MATLLSIENLKEFFDKCIRELRQEPPEVSTLYMFSGLFDVLADTTKRSEWSAVRPFMALLASEIMEFNQLMILTYGFIDETVRRTEERNFRETLNEICQTISEIKEELCERNPPDPNRIIQCIAKLDKCYLKLIRRRARLSEILQRLREMQPP